MTNNSFVPNGNSLTERQQRERDYHREFAARHSDMVETPPNLDILAPTGRRWWNSYWKIYEFALGLGLRSKRAFVPGCGFGADACRLSALGAEVYASDVSPEVVTVARERAIRAGFDSVKFDAMPAESTTYEDDFFDIALFTGVFHHIDIADGVRELLRIMRPGGTVIAHEVYSHTLIQKLRESWPVARLVYPVISRFLYGKEHYITEDERKLNQRELEFIRSHLCDVRISYFNLLQGRLFPSRMTRLARIDSGMLRVARPLAGVLAGRVVLMGTLRK